MFRKPSSLHRLVKQHFSIRRTFFVKQLTSVYRTRLFHTNTNQQYSSNHNKNQFTQLVSQGVTNTIKHYWATAFGKILFAFAIAFVGWLFDIWAGFYDVYSTLTREKRIAKAFEEISRRERDKVVESDHYIARPAVEQELLQLLNMESKYLLIYGEHGVGKTTLIKSVIKQARNQGRAAFYFPVEKQEGASFVESFSLALKGFDVIPSKDSRLPMTSGLVLKKHLGIGDVAPNSVAALFPSLAEAGIILQTKTNKRPILIIDACNNLDRQILKDLQDFAKEQADKKQILVVFVSSEGKAPVTLTARSAASRMTPYKIGELRREEADKFLQINGFNDPNLRSNILDITGYTFQYLSDACTYYDIERTKQLVSTSINGYLMEIVPNTWIADEKVIAVFKIILQNGFITYENYLAIFGEDLDRAKRILSGNILSMNLGVETTITFQNVATMNFLKEKLDRL